MCRYITPVLSFCLTYCWTAAGYYDSVDTSDAVKLRQTLHETIDDHTRIPYTSSATDTWDVLEAADEDPNNYNNILDLYKNASFLKYGGGNDYYQREHSWPKSYGFPGDNSQNYPYTDCHHLFLCYGSYNASRSNKLYQTCEVTCTEKPTDFNNGQGGSAGGYPGYSNWTETGIWKTWMGRRGDVARALFYMDVRYEGGTHEVTGALEPNLILTDDDTLIENSHTGNNETVAYMGIKSVLLEWHRQDPVDDLERHRNEIIYGVQGNRNPFVDHPEWVDCIFSNTNCGNLDFTGDGKTNLEDFSILAFFWDSDCDAPSWCNQTDIDKSSKVDIEDMRILLYYWMK